MMHTQITLIPNTVIGKNHSVNAGHYPSPLRSGRKKGVPIVICNKNSIQQIECRTNDFKLLKKEEFCCNFATD